MDHFLYMDFLLILCYNLYSTVLPYESFSQDFSPREIRLTTMIHREAVLSSPDRQIDPGKLLFLCYN